MFKEHERSQGINGVSNLTLSNLPTLLERLSPWDQDITALENLDHNFTISKFKNKNDQDIIQRKQHVSSQRDQQQQHHPQRLPRYPRKKQKDHQENTLDNGNNGLLRDFLQFCVVENSSNNQRRSAEGDDDLTKKMKKNRSLDEQTSHKLQSYGNSNNIHRKFQSISKSRSVKPQNYQQNSFEVSIEPKRGLIANGDGQEKSNYLQPAISGRGYQQNNETYESQNSYYKDDRIYLEQTTTGNETTMMTETDLNNEISSAIDNHTNLFQTLPNDISADRAKTSQSNQRNSSCHNLLSIQVKSKPKQKAIANELATCAQTLPLTIGTQNGSMQCQENQNKPGRLNNRINRASSQCSKTCENEGNRKKAMNKENMENCRSKRTNKTEIINSEMGDSSFNFVRKASDLTKEYISSQQPQLADDLLIKESETAQIMKLTQNHIRISRFRNVNASKNNRSSNRNNNGVLKEIIMNNISENTTLENNKPRQINPIAQLECLQQQQQQKQQPSQLKFKSQNEKSCLKSKLQSEKQQYATSEAKTNQLLQLCQTHSLKSNCEHVLRLTEYPLGIAQGCISEKQLSKILLLKKQKQKEAQVVEKEFLLNVEDLPENLLRKDICSKVPITFELINYQDIVPTSGESAENINSKISRKSSTHSRGSSAIKEYQLSQNQSDSKTARWQGSRRESRNGTPAKGDVLKDKNNENQNNFTCSNESQESIMSRKKQRQQQLVCLSMLLENNLQQRQLHQARQ